MRLDKYLKVARIIKRRTVANEICDQGKVMLNGRVAKASTEVKVGDVLTIAFGPRTVKYEVVKVVENVRSNEASELYRIIGENQEIKI